MHHINNFEDPMGKLKFFFGVNILLRLINTLKHINIIDCASFFENIEYR